MEFEELGGRCSVKSCRQHDFLPFKCADCTATFCSVHRLHHQPCVATSGSRERIPLICDRCKVTIRVTQSTLPDELKASLLKEHDCSTSARNSRRCQHPRCRTKLVIPVKCPACSKAFCVPHRSPLDHHCPSQPDTLVHTKNRSAAASPSWSGHTAPPQGYINSPLAPRGDQSVDGSLRAHYEVELDGTVAFWFFHRRWSLAKVVEQITPGQRARIFVGGAAVSLLDLIGSIPQHTRLVIVREETGTCAMRAAGSKQASNKNAAQDVTAAT